MNRTSPEALIPQLQLTGAGQALWQPSLSLAEFADQLIERGLRSDALQVFAHVLDKRRAIWWGCLCCWEALRPEPAPSASRAIQHAVRWVLEPSEQTRRATREPGEVAGMGTAAGNLALAVLWSGVNINPPGLPEVPPPPHLSGLLVAAAVLLAAVERGPEQTVPLHCRFLGFANEVGAGRHLWADQPAVAVHA